MTSLCLVFKHKTLMFRGTFVFNKWGARAIEMPSQCRAAFSFKGHVCCRRPELSAALPSTPLHLSTLFHTTANTKHFTPGGWPVTPGVTDLQWDHCCRVIQLFHPSTPSCHPRHNLLPKNANTEAAFHCRLRRDCLPLKSFVNAPDPTLIPLLGVKGVLSRDMCQWHMARC